MCDQLSKSTSLVWKKEKGYWIGNEEKTIGVLLSAGVHPKEEAGIWALLKIIANDDFLQTHNELRYQVIPCRNEKGFAFIDSMKGRKITLRYSDDTLSIFEDGKELLFLIREKTEKESLVLEKIRVILKEMRYEGVFGIITKLSGLNVSCNLYLYEGNRIIDFNSYYEGLEKCFSYSRNEILKKYKNVLWIDLHESMGEETFVYVDKRDKLALTVAYEYIEFCKKNHIQIRKESKDRVMIDEGIFDIGFMKDRSGGKCQELILETGIDSELSRRIELNYKIINYLATVLERMLC